jgi:hypothetical protein
VLLLIPIPLSCLQTLQMLALMQRTNFVSFMPPWLIPLQPWAEKPECGFHQHELLSLISMSRNVSHLCCAMPVLCVAPVLSCAAPCPAARAVSYTLPSSALAWILVFQIKPKFHFFLHIACFARFCNPKYSWCYSDEDSIGKIAKVAHAVSSGRGPFSVSRSLATRYLFALALRIHRRRKYYSVASDVA